MPSKNAPRFLDYRRSPLPLDVALSFALPSRSTSNSNSNSNCNNSARALILSGSVRVNNTIETNCHRLVCRHDDRIVVVISDEDKKVLLERPIRMNIALPRYFICYKPRGVVCSSRRNEGIDREDSVLISEWLANVLHNGVLENGSGGNDISRDVPTVGTEKLLDTKIACDGGAKAIKTVGRLDEESEGLLLITNDGSFSRLLCDPEFGLKKTYRVVVRGSGYGRMVAGCCSGGECENHDTNEEIMEERLLHSSNDRLAERIVEMIERGNRAPGTTNTTSNNNNDKSKKHNTTTPPPHFPFESCHVLDAGKLPTQHSSDDSYYALVDLVLREGKRHAVRRIIKNAGGGGGGLLRVCYLSRVAVEGLEGAFEVVKPKSIMEAEERGFLPGGRHRTAVPAGELVFRSSRGDGRAVGNDDCGTARDADDDCSIVVLHPGNVMELRGCDVDRIFALRRAKMR